MKVYYMINTIINLIFWSLMVIHTIINSYISWSYKRRETYAVLTSKDDDHKVLKINPNRADFKYKDESYLTPNNKSYSLILYNKHYIRYVRGMPQPIKWSSDIKPDIPSDVLHSVIESHGLKLLNTPPTMFDMKKIIMIVIAIIVIIIVYNVFVGGGEVPT